MKNLRLVLVLVLISLVSVVIVQAQEGQQKGEGILQTIFKIFFEKLNIWRWVCQIFYGGPCPKADTTKISQLAVFIMIAVMVYDILVTVSPFEEWVSYVFGFALAVICANTPLIEKITNFMKSTVGSEIGAALILIVGGAIVIFLGFWLSGRFGGAIVRAGLMARAKRRGVEKAKPFVEFKEWVKTIMKE